MTFTITTNNGSVYTINEELKTWHRLKETSHSGHLRTVHGEYEEYSIENNYLTLVSKGLEFGTRFIRTSPIVKIEEA